MANGPVYIITPEVSEKTGTECFGSSTAAGTLASNLLKMQPTDIWRSNTTAPSYVDIDLGDSYEVACAALLFTNLDVGNVWYVKAGGTQGAALYDSGNMTFTAFFDSANTPRRHLIHIPATPQTYRWWRIGTTSTVAAALTAGNFILGSVWRPATMFGGMAWGGDVAGEIVTTDGGNLIPTAPWREMAPDITLTLLSVTKAEHEEKIYRLMRLRKARKPVLIARDLSDANYTQQSVIYGLITDMTQIEAENLNLWRVRVTVRGMI